MNRRGIGEIPILAAIAAFARMLAEHGPWCVVAVEEMLLVGGALIGIARRDMVMPSTPISIISSKKAAVRSGSEPSNKVQLIWVRKTLALGQLDRGDGLFIDVPSRQTDLSCMPLSPSRWMDQVK